MLKKSKYIARCVLCFLMVLLSGRCNLIFISSVHRMRIKDKDAQDPFVETGSSPPFPLSYKARVSTVHPHTMLTACLFQLMEWGGGDGGRQNWRKDL